MGACGLSGSDDLAHVAGVHTGRLPAPWFFLSNQLHGGVTAERVRAEPWALPGPELQASQTLTSTTDQVRVQPSQEGERDFTTLHRQGCLFSQCLTGSPLMREPPSLLPVPSPPAERLGQLGTSEHSDGRDAFPPCLVDLFPMLCPDLAGFLGLLGL